MLKFKLLVVSYVFLFVCYTDAIDFTWFIGGADNPNSSANISECGRTAEIPCTNLSIVLAASEVFEVNGVTCAVSTDEGNRSSTTVIFLNGTHVAPALCLFNWTNVYVEGKHDVTIEYEKIGEYGIFAFSNSTNITIVNLNFAVNTPGRSALSFENCTDVSVLSCVYDLVAVGSNGIVVTQPQGSLVISGSTFRGSISHNVLNPVSSRGLKICYGEGHSTVRIEDCNFKDFYADTGERHRSFGSVSSIGPGLVLSFSEMSAGHFVEVSRCIFTMNCVNSASTLVILFDSTSQQNSVLVNECDFIGNLNLYGAVGIYYWGLSSNNNVTIRGSIFTNNTAHLEGGGIFTAFLSEHVTNLLTIDNCTFEKNTANEGAAVFLFNSPKWFSNAVDISEELVSVNVTDCLFTNNTALGSDVLNVGMGTEGIINALRIRLFFTNTKYVCTCIALYHILHGMCHDQ